MKIERLLLFLILAMLAIGTVIDTTGNQRLEDTVEQTDLIAQCLDPTSDCAKLTAERDKREREYLEKLMKVTNICVVHASRATTDLPIQETIRLYDECVEAGAPPEPAPVTKNGS